jgi:hypothetical protein
MADFMRNAGALSMQGQQQQAAQQQQFGVPPNQLNGQMNGGMHDFNAPQLMQQSLSGNNMGNMPFGTGGNAAALQAAIQQRQLAQLQNGGPAVTRQLELLMAQQQPQNGMANNLAARIAAVQQRQQQQQQQAGMGMGQNQMTQQNPFSLAHPSSDNGLTGSMAGPSGHGGMPQQTPGVPNTQDPPRMLSLDDLKAHAARLKQSIVVLDNETNAIINSKPDAEMQQRVNQLRQERLQRLNVLKKVIQAIQDMSRGQPINVGNIGNGGPGGQNQNSLNQYVYGLSQRILPILISRL